MPLTVVSELIRNGGRLPQPTETAQTAGKRPFFSKRNGLVFGGFWFIFFTLFMTSCLGILGAPGELIGLIAVIGVFGTMLIMLASIFLLPTSKRVMPNTGESAMPEAGDVAAAALPPAHSIPVDLYGAPKTGNWRDDDLRDPGSVTEATTRALHIEDGPQ
ncbi:MAG: hypothetical protein IT172_00740 [Acidobacteria bacterium]|nr:hypothetical protein [Acidobacteriota bacterium]